MDLRTALKDYGEEGTTRKRELGQSVAVVNLTRKRNRGTGKYWEERVDSEKLGIERGDLSKKDYARVPVEVWNIRAWRYWIIQEDSALDLLMEGMLIWWKRNITRSLIKSLNITSSAWRGKLKGFGKIWWDKVNWIYKSEGEGGILYSWTVEGIEEYEDVLAGRDCIHRAMQCTWWGREEGSHCFF